MFHVGQLVVCIDDQWHSKKSGDLPHPSGMPKRGGIYEVAGAEERCGFCALYFAEFPPFADRHHEISIFFASGAFRPVQHDRIAVFTALLEPKQTSINENKNA